VDDGEDDDFAIEGAQGAVEKAKHDQGAM